MKRVGFILLLLCLSLSGISQDIVYDSIRGDRNYWRKIRYGSDDILNSTLFENDGIIARSKVLFAAREWDGLVLNRDYTIRSFSFPTDTVTFEFKTSSSTNLVIYQYSAKDTLFYVGLRKAPLGANIFEGKYLVVLPIIRNGKCVVDVYNGIGTTRRLSVSLKDGVIGLGDVADYLMSDQVTIRVISGATQRLVPTIQSFTPIDTIKPPIKVWPNPVVSDLNIDFGRDINSMIMVYDNKASLRYRTHFTDRDLTLDFSHYISGFYIVVVTDYDSGSILEVLKVVKI